MHTFQKTVSPRVTIPTNKCSKHLVAGALALVLGLLVGGLNSHAMEFIWTNTAAVGNWSDCSNWLKTGIGIDNGNCYPGQNFGTGIDDAAIFTNPRTYKVVIDIDPATVGSNYLSNASNTTATVTFELNGVNHFNVQIGGDNAFIIGEHVASTTTVYMSSWGSGPYDGYSCLGRHILGRNGCGTLILTNGIMTTGTASFGTGAGSSGHLLVYSPTVHVTNNAGPYSVIYTNLSELNIGSTNSYGNSVVVSNGGLVYVESTFRVGSTEDGADGGSSNNTVIVAEGGVLSLGGDSLGVVGKRITGSANTVGAYNNLLLVKSNGWFDGKNHSFYIGWAPDDLEYEDYGIGLGTNNVVRVLAGGGCTNLSEVVIQPNNILDLQGGVFGTTYTNPVEGATGGVCWEGSCTPGSITNFGLIQGWGRLQAPLISINSGGVLNVKNSQGTLTNMNSLSLRSGSILQVELGTNFHTTVVTSNLLIEAGSVLNITNAGGFTCGTWPLFTYGHNLTYKGWTIKTNPNANCTYTIDTNTVGQVNLIVSGCELPEPPVVTSQPQSLTTCCSNSVVFSVTASGCALTYQWQKNETNLTDGGNVSGSTTDVLTLNPTTISDAGGYRVIISNAYGSVTSSNATLTVSPSPSPPVITSQPQSVTVCSGNPAVFSVTNSGCAPFAYQWQKDNSNIQDATSSTLTLNNVTTNDAGSYTVIISNGCGSVTSSNATLTVLSPPVITNQPQSVTVCSGNPAVFTVAASGTTPLAYQWQKNGTPLTNGGTISGSTSGTLTLSATTPSSAGNYRVIITNTCGSVTSSNATLTVEVSPPVVIGQPQSVAVFCGNLAAFTVAASGTGPLAYQWQKNGSNLTDDFHVSGSTSSMLILNPTTISDAGSYRVIIANACGSVTSSDATLRVVPVIGQQVYAGTGGHLNGKVYVYQGGTNWTAISDALGDAVLDIISFNGRLYAATKSTDAVGAVWRYDGGTSWTVVGTNMDREVCNLEIYADQLYAGTAWNGGKLYRYNAISNHFDYVGSVSNFAGIGAMCNSSYGYLQLGDLGFDKFGRYDGTLYFDANFGGSCIYDFAEYSNKLYAAAFCGRLYSSTNGINWSLVLDCRGADHLWKLDPFQGKLYLGYDDGELAYIDSSEVWHSVLTDFDSIISMVADTNTTLYFGTGQEMGYGGDGSGPGYVYAYTGNGATNATLISGPMGDGVQCLYSLGSLFTWINPAGGSWTNGTNWLSGAIGSGVGNTADFSTLDLTNDATVTLDGARTIGNLVFGDTTPDHNWTLNTGAGGPLTLAVMIGSPTIWVANQIATINADVAGTSGLAKTGAGTLVLGGAGNSWSGGTMISYGLLQIGNGGPGSIGTGTITNYASLSFGATNNILVNDAIVGSGSLTKTGAGVLTLSGTNTYSGDTTVRNGTLLVNNAAGSGTGSGTVTVVSGATLGGTGTIGGPVTVNGTLAPGNNGAGTLTISNNLVVNNGAVLQYDLGTSSDRTVVSSNLTLGGTLNITDSGGFGAGTYTLFTYTSTLTDNGLVVGATPNPSLIYTIDTTSTPYQVKLNVVPLTAFQQWQLHYFDCADCPQAAGTNDPDGDRMSNTNEFLAGFNPTNSAAYLHVVSIVKTANDINVTYLGANGDTSYEGGPVSRTNVLDVTKGTADGSYSNNFVSTGQTNILSGGSGLGTNVTVTDVGGATNVPSRYYRIRVLVP